MARQIADLRTISSLIAVVLFLIIISLIGFGSAVVYSIARLQSNIQNVYVNPFAVSNAGMDAHVTLSQMHIHMLGILLAKDSNRVEQQFSDIMALDKNLRKDLSIVKSGFQGDSEKIVEIDRLLDDWQNMRAQMVSLVRLGHRDQALTLATGGGVKTYSQLEAKMSYVVASAHHHVETLVEETTIRSSKIINFVWWFFAGLIISIVLAGILVIRKVGTILEYNRQTTKRLHESEERLKLALSGADEGTWDFDIHTERLNFDSQWGAILGFVTEKERPHCLKEWAELIHIEDRNRVLKAMNDHIEGRSDEYKSEYRIRSRSGAMKWVAGHGRAVRRDADGKALRIVGVTRDITMRKRAEDKIWQLAHSDVLTGLPNRSLFYDRLKQSIAQAKRYNKKIALLFLDLDDFKQVNDTFGHDTGDGLLMDVAKRLRQDIRGEDTVARTGGDEFIFILNDISHTENAAFVASKIISSLNEPFVIHGHTCLIGSSIGISIFPDDSDDIGTLVTQSDDAMYKAKERGKNNYQFFAPPPLFTAVN